MFRPIVPVTLALALSSSLLGAQSLRRDGAPMPTHQTQFGIAIALLGDQAFVGEPVASNAPGGAVHVYRRSAAGWQAAGRPLSLPDLAAGGGFGSSLAADGNTLLVGMRNIGDSARGGVQMFTRGADGGWTNAGPLWATPPARSSFGSSVALAGDWAFVGAPTEQPAGAVYAFQRVGGQWAERGKLVASDLATGDRFGAALSVSGDAVAVSAPGHDTQKGTVVVFRRGADGGFAEEARVAGRRVPANGQMGLALQLAGDRLWAGAPNANGFAGMVVGFERAAADGAWQETTTLAPFEAGAARFGIALASVGDELWVGAPFSDNREGRVFRVSMHPDGGLTAMTKLATDSISSGSGFGAVLAVTGSTAMVGMPNDAGNAGTVTFLDRSAQGTWALRSMVYPAGDGFAAVTGAEVPCGDDNTAGDFTCGNSSLLAFLPISQIGGRRGVNLNDNWGWTDPESGREYAIVGRTDGTSFVDVTDPTRPRYLGDLPMTAGSNPAGWRDMKVYKDHVFVVADGAGQHGVQVFDLTRLRDVRTPQTFTEDAHYDRVGSSHNIVMNEETGFAYAVGVSSGGETCGGGLHMINVQDPKHPTFAGCFSDEATGRTGTGYSHDAQCVVYRGPDQQHAGREICIGSNETAISIADVTDKANPVALSRASHPNVGYTHQGWLTDDHRYFYVNDELDEQGGLGKAAEGTRTMVWDLADLDDPVLLKEHVGVTKSIDHNLYVKGNRMYQANYTSGLRILDISDPANPREVGYFDTFPGHDNPQFAGSWSNYPYFKSGTIVVTGIGEGLFLVRDRTQAVP
jgi:choice-of-anchor B domain-containing protein